MKQILIVLMTFVFAGVAFGQGGVTKSPTINILGGAIPQDSLDNKMPKVDSNKVQGYATYEALRDSVFKKLSIAHFNDVVSKDSLYRAAQEAAIRAIIEADSLYARSLLARDSTYRAAQEAAIRGGQAADSTYKAAQLLLRQKIIAGVTQESWIVPVDSVTRTACPDSIGATVFLSSGTAGMYEVSGVLVTTTATGAGSVTLHLTYTDAGAVRDDSVRVALTSTDKGVVVMPIQVETGAIEWSTTIDGAIGTSRYAIFLQCRRLF